MSLIFVIIVYSIVNMKGIVVEPLVYCLKSEDDKYYVGMTYNFNLRYAQHECGEGSRWWEDPFECLPDEQIEQELTVEFLQRFEEEVKESG
eukprot:SAG22_NODE_9053_length_612_cov_3.249513_1_plen_90_part_10